MFKLEDCLVRPSCPADRKDLIEISRGIWEGNDYLPKILDRWLQEDWFFVCEYQGKVIACLKLTTLPDNVLWFEGLRVHRRYQGKGIAKLMNHQLMRFAQQLKAQNPQLTYEFCTYYKNVESLAITRKMGSQEVEGYYNLERRGLVKTLQPEIITDYGTDIFCNHPQYLPLNWHVVHSVKNSLPYIRKHATVFKGKAGLYLVGSIGERCITLLSDLPDDLNAELPYLQSIFGSRKRMSLTLPASMSRQIPRLEASKFYFWGEDREVALNMLVFRIPAQQL
ncbi:MAG: GNAT family N-acetyltransferase [Candidatus Cloacimonetes bacterium]|nr:GNAT family N-acetyltransferase [Candidatus Cloacimonadota bacterium]MDY0336577.1 GNAT family N-acetyltransferase [Candidatus Cloacimonadaceae bacterium]MCK9334405.1 GNAT family N-acetyltransferase [Candidatus Cloacimonadota bacterium]MDD2543177.1 GNAT family N-acetyltransferase [Candidatus Cloacimonadota bacterium]MDD2682821.1 GNAT family N-acetyltransferase [Candidatus Cloacimonadota bacterium]